MRENSNCTFCNREPETYRHMFLSCELVKNFWIEVEKFMDGFDTTQINFDEDTVFWNRLVAHPVHHIKNLICCVAKQYIYKE